MTQEELTLVFDALKDCNTYAFAGGFGKRATAHRDALATLEKALAQPAQDVAAWARYPRYTGRAQLPEIVFKKPEGKDWLELYAHASQRTWVGLTDEEISESSKGHMTRNGFAKTIEAKLKELNA